MEEHCSAYELPTRGVIAIVATAISQVSQDIIVHSKKENERLFATQILK